MSNAKRKGVYFTLGVRITPINSYQSFYFVHSQKIFLPIYSMYNICNYLSLFVYNLFV